MERAPKVDVIEGLSPSIAIEQKTTTRSPRSTDGTITEIYDYLRVVYASVGVPHCRIAGSRLRATAGRRGVRERTNQSVHEPFAGGKGKRHLDDGWCWHHRVVSL